MAPATPVRPNHRPSSPFAAEPDGDLSTPIASTSSSHLDPDPYSPRPKRALSPSNHLRSFSLNGIPHPLPSPSLPSFDTPAPPQYAKGDTIDWPLEEARERARLVELNAKPGLAGVWGRIWDQSAVWVVLVISGIITGLLAASLDVLASYLADLRTGYCTTSFLAQRAACCAGSDPGEVCDEWQTYASALGISNLLGTTMVQYLIYFGTAGIFATSAAVLVQTYAPYAFHTGLPEIKSILGGLILPGFLSPIVLLIKAIGLSLSVASGLSLGKEGPLIHVACCISDALVRSLHRFKLVGWSANESRKRQLYSATAAAGVSVAFGAPLGGVLFALEELDIHLFPASTLWQAFVCAMVAAVSLQWFNPFRTGKLVLYSVTANQPWKSFELMPWLILGALGGLLGSWLIKLNILFARTRARSAFLSENKILEVAVVAGLTAVLSYLVLFMRVQSSDLVAALFQECSADSSSDVTDALCDPNRRLANIFLLLLSALFKTVLTAYTFGISVPAGVFLPGLTIGACLGRALGLLLQSLRASFPELALFAACRAQDSVCITPGLYATVGAAATLAGITRMTVSLVVIVFELTGALSHVIPIMLAVMTAKWVADVFGKEGIYAAWISFRRYPYLPQAEYKPVEPGVLLAEDAMTSRVVSIPAEGTALSALDDILLQTSFAGFPVLRPGGIIVGYITRTELQVALQHVRQMQSAQSSTSFSFLSGLQPGSATVDLHPWLDEAPLVLPSRLPAAVVVTTFQRLNLVRVLLASRGRLRGILTKRDVVKLAKQSARGRARLPLCGLEELARGTSTDLELFELLEDDEEDEERRRVGLAGR